MTQLTSWDSNATVVLFVSNHALITYKSAVKIRHDKFWSIKTKMNEKIIFQSNYISTKVSDSEILKPHAVQSTKPEKSLTQYWPSENGWEFFGEMKAQSLTPSSGIARGCLKLSVGGPQACKVTHNWEFSEQSIAQCIAEEWDATAFGTLCIAHLVP